MNKKNEFYLLNSSSLSELISIIKEDIIDYLINRGINIDRLYFTDFPFLKLDIENKILDDINGTSIKIYTKNNIDELYNIICNNNINIIINLNSTIALSIENDELNEEILNKYKNNISWGYML